MRPLTKLLEAALFSAARPVTFEELLALDQETGEEEVRVALTELKDRYDVGDHGVELVELAGERAVFGGATGLVRSSALLRLRFGSRAPVGILALGSRRDEMFHPGQGTELLCFLGRVLELCVRAWLDLPD